jgi:pilus assembly protein Flp/PilA
VGYVLTCYAQYAVFVILEMARMSYIRIGNKQSILSAAPNRIREKGEREMTERIMKLLKDEEGATMVEYALMVALIAVVCITVVTSLGTGAKGKFTTASDELAK